MKKYILFFGLIIFCKSLMFAQTPPVFEPSSYDSLSYGNSDCKFITVFMDKDHGTFKFRTQNGLRSLLFDEIALGPTYNSYANFWIGKSASEGKVFSMKPSLVGATTVTVRYISKENNRFRVEFKEPEEIEGVKITQELIVRENSAKESGAVLIKYTFTNTSETETKFVGVALKLDTYLGYHLKLQDELNENNYHPIAVGNDNARIALPTGFIHEKTNIIPIPDYWLAFEDEEDPKALIARGTLRGKDLVPPDFLYVGEFEDIRYILYDERNLPTVGGYGDSEIFMRWDRRRIEPGETISVATLYGMLGATGCDDGVISVNSDLPFDTLTVDDNGKYEPSQFDYIATVHSLKNNNTITNVKATIQIQYDNKFFELVNDDVTKPLPQDTLKFGEGQVVSWKVRIKDLCIDQLEHANIGVNVTYMVDGESLVEFCPNTVYFLPKEIYSLNIQYDPSMGNIIKSPDKDKYFCGEIVNITATAIADQCYDFVDWKGDIDSKDNKTSVTMQHDMNITANFKNKVSLTTSVVDINGINIDGVASVSILPNKTEYYCGDEVKLTVKIEPCYEFLYWEDDHSNNKNPRDITMNGSNEYKAVIDIKRFSLQTSIDFPYSGNVIVDPKKDIYFCGENVKLSITPECPYDFVRWEGVALDKSTQREINIVIDTNKNIVAHMAKISFDVLKSEPNIFPNIVVDLKIDSANNNGVWQLPVTRSQFTVRDVDSAGNSKEIKDFNLINNSQNSQIVYSLYGNCYDKITDLKRKTIVKFVHNGCTNIDTAMYTINLNAGCDSCSRPLKRVVPNALLQNRPNPYNPETIIKYSLAEDEHVFIAVYDVLGREVATLVNEPKEAGEYEVLFKPKGWLSSGVYFYRMKTNNFHDVKKMTFVK